MLVVDRTGGLFASLLAVVLASLAFLVVGGGLFALSLLGDLGQVPLCAGTGFVLDAAVAYAVSVRWAHRSDMRIASAVDGRRLLTVRQESIRWLIVRYVVLDAHEEVVARLRRNYATDLLRRRWEVSDRDGRPLAVAGEDALALALARRLLGSFFDLLRTNYILTTPEGERLGRLDRRLTLLDRSVLDLVDDRNRVLERRVAGARGDHVGRWTSPLRHHRLVMPAALTGLVSSRPWRSCRHVQVPPPFRPSPRAPRASRASRPAPTAGRAR